MSSTTALLKIGIKVNNPNYPSMNYSNGFPIEPVYAHTKAWGAADSFSFDSASPGSLALILDLWPKAAPIPSQSLCPSLTRPAVVREA